MAQKRAANRQRWREVLERQRASGLSGLAFCRREGLSPKLFYMWRRRLAKEAKAAEAPPLFVPVGVGGLAAPPVEVVFGETARVRIPSGCEAGTIREVLAVLRRPSC